MLWNTLGRNIEMIKQNLFTGRWRPVSVGVTAAICLAILLSFAPVRQAAADFLGIFRVRKFAAIPVDPAQAQRLESLANSLDEGANGKPTTVREAGAPQPVDDAAQASATAGFPVRMPAALPDGANLESFITQSGPALHFEIDPPTLQALLSAAGVEGATIPDAGTITADVDVPVMVAQEYALGGSAKLTLVQAPSPEVVLPAGVDPIALGQLGLQVLGIPAADAERWLEALLGSRHGGREAAAAIAEVAALTGDAARDVSAEARARALATLEALGAPDDLRRSLTDVMPGDRLRQGARYFGEDLPSGLTLVE
jgi:hypothetical protein